MKIQQKNGKLQISTNGCKVEVSDSVEIKSKEGEIFNIIDAGEYEFSGVMVQAIPKMENKEVLFFSIDIEGINLVYVNSKLELPNKKQVEQVGLNNILIINAFEGIEKVRDIIDLFEPEYVVPLTDNTGDLDMLAKKLGVVLPEKQSTFNITFEQFENSNGELALQLFILE